MQTPGFLVKTQLYSYTPISPSSSSGDNRKRRLGTGSIRPPASSALSSLTGGREGRQGGREAAGVFPLTGLDQWWTSKLALPQNIFLGFLGSLPCWQSLTDLSFDVGASLSQSGFLSPSLDILWCSSIFGCNILPKHSPLAL